MNYCIINSVKSTTIQGLLISSLPPITKPKIRTSVEEIDGRDGDIVTELGYSAYDKTMTIGLFGNYDIDEVIQYFDSEGTVIFSNEPDKFYRFEIIEQIDFERLARFKTANVVFHVQPFKFSAVDDAFSEYKNQLNVRVYSSSQYGVNINVSNNVISVSGEATRNCEFYIPINPMTLEAKQYTLEGQTSGTGTSGCQIRVIGSVPTDADSFGGQAIQLDSTIELTDTLTEPKTFNYIWISIANGTDLDMSLSIQMMDDSFNSFKVFNRGNKFSKPKLTIYGQGNITLSINGVQYFVIALGNNGYIVLDGDQMDAYKGDTLMNRYVAGDYNNLKFKVGANTLSWTGNVTQVTVENISRWV